MAKSLEEIVKESTLRKKMKEEKEKEKALREKERRIFVRGILNKNKKHIGVLINNGESLSYILEQINALEGSDIKKNEFEGWIEFKSSSPVFFLLTLVSIIFMFYLGYQGFTENSLGYLIVSVMLLCLSVIFAMSAADPKKDSEDPFSI